MNVKLTTVFIRDINAIVCVEYVSAQDALYYKHVLLALIILSFVSRAEINDMMDCRLCACL